MKTALKVILVLVILVVLGVVGLVVFVLSNSDSIAKRVIQEGGTYAMGVTTTVDTVHVDLISGDASMSGLVIDNPSGFSTDHFFTLAASDASVNIKSINSDKVIIPTIKLSGLDVILDKGASPSNYNTILNNLQRFESGDKAKSNDEKAGKNVVINSLVLENINIHVANMPGVSLLTGDVAVKIPEITLQNVGEKESMKAGDIFNLVIKTVLAAAVEAGGGIIPGDVLNELGNGLSGLESLSDMGIEVISNLPLDDVMGGIGEAVDEIGKQGEDLKKGVDDAAREIGDKIDNATNDIKDIFNKKKKDDTDEP